MFLCLALLSITTLHLLAAETRLSHLLYYMLFRQVASRHDAYHLIVRVDHYELPQTQCAEHAVCALH